MAVELKVKSGVLVAMVRNSVVDRRKEKADGDPYEVNGADCYVRWRCDGKSGRYLESGYVSGIVKNRSDSKT